MSVPIRYVPHRATRKRFRRLKQSLLPYMSPPAGSSPTAGKITCYCRPGEFVIDIDHISSSGRGDPLEGHAVRRRAATPRSLLRESQPGNQLLVPYRLSIKKTVEDLSTRRYDSLENILRGKYGLKADATNADLSRACFLCHDPSARLREN